MKLTEAIEVLTAILDIGVHAEHPHHEDAIKLGIEALKLYKFCKGAGEHVDPALLPGETEE